MRNFLTSERPFTLCRNLIKLAMTSAFLVVVDVIGWVGGCVCGSGSGSRDRTKVLVVVISRKFTFIFVNM